MSKIPMRGEVIRETEKAYLFVDEDGTEHWVPKSQCDWDCDNELMHIPQWLIDKF